MSEATDNGSKGAGNGKASSPGRPLPKRFYEAVTVAEAAAPAGGGVHTWSILLDGKTVRTPAKAVLAVPTRALAEAVAEEWRAQGERIDPATMPLTRLVNSAIDGVRGREAAVRDDIAKYAASDLLCYRAEQPEGLMQRQAELWDPILAWSRENLGADLAVAEGLMPVAQPDAARAAIASRLIGYDAFALAALHVVTTLTGSALLALAHARGRLDAEAAWAAAHIDEDWQIAKWGEDAEATARRQRRWQEMQAASRLLGLLGAA